MTFEHRHTPGRLRPLLVGMVICAGLSGDVDAQGRLPVPIIGGPCEGCEGVFEGMPSSLGAVARIASPDEPGEPMIIDGTVRNGRGAPEAGIIIYAYQTDANGVYRPDETSPGASGRRHGQLRAWAMTDSLGHYRFLTIRPGHYPGRTDPAHVHMHVIEPGCCTYYIASIHFRDDPILSKEARDTETAGRGGSGLTTPIRDADGIWHVERDIRLGVGIPGYDAARQRQR